MRMPRVKAIEAIEYDDDFDGYDEAYDEPMGDDDGITTEDKERLREGRLEVRQLLGPDFQKSDRDIEETLWYYYFDISKSVNYLLSQIPQEKARTNAKEKKATEKKLASEKLTQCFGVQISKSAPFPFEDFFHDAPWLNVPLERRGYILEMPGIGKGGLLGGSSRRESDRPRSKLAALAAARRKENQDRRIETPVNESVALLDKLKRGLTSTTTNRQAESHDALDATLTTPGSASGFRRYASRPRKLSEAPSEELKAPVEKQIEDSSMAGDSRDGPVPVVPKASPSIFAAVIVGDPPPAANLMTHSTEFYDTSTLVEYTADIARGFTGPSPDDKVLKAQNTPKGTTTKAKSSKSTPEGETHELAQTLQNVTIDDNSKVKSKNIDVAAEFARVESKRAASFVVIGHVDAGKSTLMGRLLHDLNIVDQRTVNKYRKEAERLGKGSFALAWVMDQGTEERERGVTIDIANFNFETSKTTFTILDAPGHRDFIPNMIAGASQADFALLVIDASAGNFESGLRGQTREHILLVRSMGVQRIVVAVNKLDMVEWSKERFEEIHQQMLAFLTTAGFHEKHLAFVPCSGLSGDNIVTKSANDAASWYKGSPLITLLEDSDPVARAIEKPFRLTIDDVFRGGVQNPLSVSGRLDAGTVQIGEIAVALPASQDATIKAIDVDGEPREWAVAGQIVTLHLNDIDAKYLKAGDILSSTSDVVPVQRSFTVKVLAFEHIMPMPCEIHRGRLHAPGRVAKLDAAVEKNSGTVMKGKRPKVVKPGLLAKVVIEVDEAIPIEKGSRVILRADGETIGAGLVE